MKPHPALRPLIPVALAFACSAAPAMAQDMDPFMPTREDKSILDYDPARPLALGRFQAFLLTSGADYVDFSAGFATGLDETRKAMGDISFFAKNTHVWPLPEHPVQKAAFIAARTCMIDAADQRIENYEQNWGVQGWERRDRLKVSIATSLFQECGARLDATLKAGFLTPPYVTANDYTGVSAMDFTSMKHTPF